MILFPSKSFTKDIKKLSKLELNQVKTKLKIMEENLNHPSLRTKKFKSVEGLFESSINMDIRIIWTFVDNGILLLKCVHHSHLNKI